LGVKPQEEKTTVPSTSVYGGLARSSEKKELETNLPEDTIALGLDKQEDLTVFTKPKREKTQD